MITIETATIFDVETVAPLFDQYRVFYRAESDPDGARRFLFERLVNQQSTVLMAWNANGVLVGFAQLYPFFSSVSMRKKYILNDLFVIPAARKCGAGKALLEGAKAFAIASGAIAMTLSTAIDNAHAQALYHANGWKLEKDTLNFDFFVEGDAHA